MPNIERIKAVLDSIEADLSKWDQDFWAKVENNHPSPENNFCGAKFCMAGHAAIAAGYYPAKSINYEYDPDQPITVNNVPYLFADVGLRVR